MLSSYTSDAPVPIWREALSSAFLFLLGARATCPRMCAGGRDARVPRRARSQAGACEQVPQILLIVGEEVSIQGKAGIRYNVPIR